MEATTQEFSLGRESGDDGAFERQDSAFRDWVSTDGSTPYPAEAGRYHIYAAWACPWAQRAIIARRLKGLEDAIGLSIVHPIRDSRGWRFTGGEYTDDAEDFDFLAEAYNESDPEFDDRASTPVLWDTQERADRQQRVGRGAADARGRASRSSPTRPRSTSYPAPIRAEIDALNDRIYDAVNNGVYKAGFTTNQEIYERRGRATLRDARRARRAARVAALPVRRRCRSRPTGACSRRCCASTPSTTSTSSARCGGSSTTRTCGRTRATSTSGPGIAETVRFDDIRRHYYCTHPMINPNKLVAVQPEARLGRAARRRS